ncbi:hypothetical protein O3P69_014031 [Scylla paramamosain]|uniref:Uncharacterized protein n=1 Tax=Scylla paramamosain TaxID=85552 RepID=A0AAW0SS61_SCYPA
MSDTKTAYETHFNFRSSSTPRVWGGEKLKAGDGVCGQGAGRDLAGLHHPSRFWFSSKKVRPSISRWRCEEENVPPDCVQTPGVAPRVLVSRRRE